MEVSNVVSVVTMKLLNIIFFYCHIARLIWRIIHVTFDLYKPSNVSHIFGSWLQVVRLRQKNLILTGVSVVSWAIWLSKNDVDWTTKLVCIFFLEPPIGSDSRLYFKRKKIGILYWVIEFWNLWLWKSLQSNFAFNLSTLFGSLETYVLSFL